MVIDHVPLHGPGEASRPAAAARLDLYWIPLGAGAGVVRASGKIYEALCALVERRPRAALYHSVLVAKTAHGQIVVEMAPIPDDDGLAARGVVGEGPVGVRWGRHFRLLRYEVRRWRSGTIPDLAFAVGSPVCVTDDVAVIQEVLELLALVPTPVWGRDEFHTGEMWNSNSVVSWVLTQAGVVDRVARPPGGRAPGWDAGVLTAQRRPVRWTRPADPDRPRPAVAQGWNDGLRTRPWRGRERTRRAP